MKNKRNINSTIALAVCFILLLVAIGCKTSTEYEVDKLAKPVYVAAIGPDGEVVLRGADGKVVMIPGTYYMAHAIANSLEVGDIFIPEHTGN